MKKLKFYLGILIGTALLVWVALFFVARIPYSTSHLHGDELVETHLHTHDGPFSHDHFHLGLANGTTHSHPHQHPTEHVQLPEELQDWGVIGHVHDQDRITVFVARSCYDEQKLVVEFSRYRDGELLPCESTSARNVGEIFVGNKRQDRLLFKADGNSLVASNISTRLISPISTLVLPGVRFDSGKFDVVVPIKRDVLTTEPAFNSTE